MLSKSTRLPSNSGPSTQTNFVFPPTLTRHPPHIPVPSIMIVFRETVVGMAKGFVTAAHPFIISAGPIAKTLSGLGSREHNSLKGSVTNPLRPLDPSSVQRMNSSAKARILSSMMRRFSLLAPAMKIRRLPALFMASAIGKRGAVPMPPPTQTTVPKRSILVGEPRGPRRFSTVSPSLMEVSPLVVFPMAWTTRVMVPASASASAMVRGILSPNSVLV